MNKTVAIGVIMMLCSGLSGAEEPTSPTEGYFEAAKNKADKVIEACNYDKDEIYALYVATLDSVRSVRGEARQQFNAVYRHKKYDVKGCNQIKAAAENILREHKKDIANTHEKEEALINRIDAFDHRPFMQSFII